MKETGFTWKRETGEGELAGRFPGQDCPAGGAVLSRAPARSLRVGDPLQAGEAAGGPAALSGGCNKKFTVCIYGIYCIFIEIGLY
jgi:hypothetical protein